MHSFLEEYRARETPRIHFSPDSKPNSKQINQFQGFSILLGYRRQIKMEPTQLFSNVWSLNGGLSSLERVPYLEHSDAGWKMEGDRASYSMSSRNWQRGSYRGRSGRRRKRRRKSWGERIADWTRTLIAFLFSNVGIVCLVVGYTIAGAFVFTHIEGRNNMDVVGGVIKLRNVTAATLWELTSKVAIFFLFTLFLVRTPLRVLVGLGAKDLNR